MYPEPIWKDFLTRLLLTRGKHAGILAKKDAENSRNSRGMPGGNLFYGNYVHLYLRSLWYNFHDSGNWLLGLNSYLSHSDESCSVIICYRRDDNFSILKAVACKGHNTSNIRLYKSIVDFNVSKFTYMKLPRTVQAKIITLWSISRIGFCRFKSQGDDSQCKLTGGHHWSKINTPKNTQDLWKILIVATWT